MASRPNEWRVTDKHGRSYELREELDGRGWALELWQRGTGHAVAGLYATHWDGHVHIGDLVTREPLFHRACFLGIWPYLKREPDHKGRGLGKILLQRCIELARLHGATMVTGMVIQADSRSQPWLIPWYQREGFEISSKEACHYEGPEPLHRAEFIKLDLHKPIKGADPTNPAEHQRASHRP